jgi:hypothetical protein
MRFRLRINKLSPIIGENKHADEIVKYFCAEGGK